MCFDEATSSLDNETEAQVQEAIDAISTSSSNRTTIMIAHRLNTVKNCDLIIALKDGNILEQGNHLELLSLEGGYYKRLWELQAKGLLDKKEEKKEKPKFGGGGGPGASMGAGAMGMEM